MPPGSIPSSLVGGAEPPGDVLDDAGAEVVSIGAVVVVLEDVDDETGAVVTTEVSGAVD